MFGKGSPYSTEGICFLSLPRNNLRMLLLGNFTVKDQNLLSKVVVKTNMRWLIFKQFWSGLNSYFMKQLFRTIQKNA